jgi:HSP20 family molecular chaperone IbpA
MKTIEEQRTGWAPTVTEDDKKYPIEVRLLGVAKEKILLTITRSMISIVGGRRPEQNEVEKSYGSIGPLYAPFAHNFIFPQNAVDMSTLRPEVQGEILKVHVPKRPVSVPFAREETEQGASSEGDKSLIMLTGAERASWAITKVLEAATDAGKKEGNAPSESAILLSFINDGEKYLERIIDEKFFTDNAFEMARLRGEAGKLELLEEAGPMLTVEQVAEVLNRSRQAVHKRLKNGSLFGMMRQGEFRIPAWQIREGEVVAGIAKVLKNLDTTDWGKMLFLHSENMQLEGRRPMDLILKGDTDSVAEVAALLGEQGAK